MNQVPQYAFGPRLSAVVCLLSRAYQMSRRQIRVALKELYGVEISLGSVSNIEGRMSEVLAFSRAIGTCSCLGVVPTCSASADIVCPGEPHSA